MKILMLSDAASSHKIKQVNGLEKNDKIQKTNSRLF